MKKITKVWEEDPNTIGGLLQILTPTQPIQYWAAYDDGSEAQISKTTYNEHKHYLGRYYNR